ncbi:MAG: class I SAM-dependent methyltransferase [Myxococcota bacterium]
MASLDRLRPQPDDRLAFFTGFLKRPRQVGSIIPSSRFLERRVTRTAGLADASLVVELGPGTGGTTRSFLRAMKPDAKLLAIEINPHFVDVLGRWQDPRLLVHHGSATDLRKILDEHQLPAPDAILSGIPFSTMPRALGRDILRAVHDVLEPGGCFVAYQVRDVVEGLGNEVFGHASKQTELLNVPPMRVYRWTKR